MNEVKKAIKRKIINCLDAISSLSNSEVDCKASEAVEHLARAYSYLSQIKEDEDNGTGENF